jgi:hypothetical protein
MTVQEALRRLHGDPDPSWPSMDSPRKGRAEPGWGQQPLSGIKLTAAEAAVYLGIKPRTLNIWVSRKRVSAAGRNERGERMFHAEHLVALRDKVGPQPSR